MKRTILFVVPICISILLLSFSGKNQEQSKPALLRTLIIDPGHGGIDPGARGSFSTEANVSLEVALKFGKALEKEFPDLKIIYTRTSDVMAGNKKNKNDGNRYRATLANESGGDLFIAIHCNAAPAVRHRTFIRNKTVTYYTGKGKKRRKVTKKVPQYRYWSTPNPAHGTETYIWAVGKNDAKVGAVHHNPEDYGEIDSTSTLELPDPSDPAEKARMLIYAQNFFKKSLQLADLVEKEFTATGRLSRGVKQRNHTGIWVLQATGMPSILVELGFLSHAGDEKYLNSEKGQEEMVEDLVNAFKTYKQRIESKSMSAAAADQKGF
ncbi:MAG TPA: N-acetylmuramoyl-L-alanine amidase [Chitinophagaceae bacterium]|nr:N-acetylmuramoyl-L-alanine amidase [Chitinophagaceae bacterium]